LIDKVLFTLRVVNTGNRDWNTETDIAIFWRKKTTTDTEPTWKKYRPVYR